jgi:FixJ family two-component response regulator
MSRQIVPANELFVVDDDASMREALSVVFTLAGYRVTVFADGASFLAAARDRVPAVVLLDLHLPDISGLGVLREVLTRIILQRRFSSSPVTATSPMPSKR